jgi:hypothetical protein
MAVLRRWGVRGLSIGTRDHLGAARLIIHQDCDTCDRCPAFLKMLGILGLPSHRFMFATHSAIELDPSNLTLERLLGVDPVLELVLIVSSYFVLLE